MWTAEVWLVGAGGASVVYLLNLYTGIGGRQFVSAQRQHVPVLVKPYDYFVKGPYSAAMTTDEIRHRMLLSLSHRLHRDLHLGLRQADGVRIY